MKTPIFKILSIVTITLLLSVSATSAEITPISLQYTAEESNNATNIWWDPISMATVPYNVEQNSTVSVDIDDMNDFNSILDITIGNITREGINDNEAESALAFGYWKLQGLFGFIANTSWDNVISEFNELNLTVQSVYETEGELYLRDEYASGNTDSHPNVELAGRIAPLFAQFIIDVAEGISE